MPKSIAESIIVCPPTLGAKAQGAQRRDGAQSIAKGATNKGFVLVASVKVAAIADFYGLDIEPAAPEQTLGDYVAAALHYCPLRGDRVACGKAHLVVLSAAGLRVEKVLLDFTAAARRVSTRPHTARRNETTTTRACRPYMTEQARQCADTATAG